MTRYWAEIDDANIVLRVILCDDPQWITDNLPGTWIETADPYATGQTVRYCGPGFGHDKVWPERFALPWRQPEGAHDAYHLDDLVFHDGRMWQSTVEANVWEPGVSGWHDVPASGLPMWVQPTGAHDAYALGDRVTHVEKNWRSTVDANVWEPGVYGWEEI